LKYKKFGYYIDHFGDGRKVSDHKSVNIVCIMTVKIIARIEIPIALSHPTPNIDLKTQMYRKYAIRKDIVNE